MTVLPGAALRQVVGRLGWGVGDQAVSSISNFAIGLYVARTFGASDFGAFTLAYITYSVALNAARGLSTDPLLVRFSEPVSQRWRQASAAATATALAVGAAIGVGCVLLGLLLPSPLGPVFIALGVGLPGLMVQDSWRFTFFAAGRGAQALINDLVWTVLLIGALFVMHSAGNATVVRCMLAFGATASVAAVVGAFQAKVVPRPAAVSGWVRRHRDLSFRYLAENVSISGATQVRASVLGAVAGLAMVGQVRAAEILMGPFLVVLMGLSQVAVPETSRVFHRSPQRLARFCLVLAGVQAVAALLWGVILLVVMPLGPGEALLRNLWAPASHLLPAVTLTVVAACFSTAATAGLRAMGVARRSLRAQLTASVLYVFGGVGGAVLGGAVGTCWGVTAATSLAAALWWHQLRAALAAHDHDLEGVSA